MIKHTFLSTIWLWATFGAMFCGVTPAYAYNVEDYEEAGGLSMAGFRATDGKVYGGGLESGVWLKGTPLFGEMFGHWLVNNLQDAHYYSIGMSFRIMPRSPWAPFVGAGGSYNRLAFERDRLLDTHPDYRSPDGSYWAGHLEAGIRIWYGAARAQFFEAGFRRHWTDARGDMDYDWISVELGQLF